jgi:hypothetical protein
MSDWLQNLKAGDEVILSGHYGAGVLAKVSKVTATQVVIGANRYRRDNGRFIGRRGCSNPSIREATPEARERADQSRLASVAKHRVGKVKFDALPSATWRAILDLLPPE